MEKRAVIFNLGCKVNQYECDTLAGGLIKTGYSVSRELIKARVYIINTCAVTGEAERKSRQILSRIRRLNPEALIIVTGCASQKNKDFYIEKGVQYVGGTGDRQRALEYLEKIGSGGFDISEKYTETNCLPSVDRTRAYVKIQDGCDNFCSYCIVPHLRGASRSRTVANVKKEIETVAKDTKEIVIAGINLSAYGKDNGESLAFLIKELKDVDVRLRLSSFYQEGITEELLDALFSLKDFSPHFHLSLQHGDDNILRDMNRRYGHAEYAEKVNLIRKYDKNAAVTTDIIVGYPTETEESFENCLNFVKDTGFSDIHIFPFSRREGTAAYPLKPLDGAVIKERCKRLEAVKSSLKNAYLKKMLSVSQDVIFEKDGAGYSQYYVRVYAKTDKPRAVVIPEELYKDGLKARRR